MTNNERVCLACGRPLTGRKRKWCGHPDCGGWETVHPIITLECTKCRDSFKVYGRQSKLDDVSEIIKTKEHGNYSDEEVRLILDLNSEGLTSGQIAETLWYDYGIARTMNSVYGILQRKGNNS